MTATDGASERPRGVLRRAVLAWGHHSLRLEMPLTTSAVASIVASWWVPEGDPPAWVLVVYSLAIVLALTLASALICQHFHGRELCVRCLDAIPWLDPQAATDANDRWLRLFHDIRRMRRLLILSAVPILLWLLQADQWWWQLKLPASLAALVGVWSLGRHAHAIAAHSRLRRWCPYCRRGGGGDHTPVQPPVPTGTRER